MNKRKFRTLLDTAMLILMPLLMSYSLVGETFHKWLGIAIFVMFVTHHIINASWHKSLFKGKYSAVRIIFTLCNLLLFADMILLFYSGINLSGHIFKGLPTLGSLSLSRVLHLSCSHWGLVLMSLHLGFHGKSFGGFWKNETVKRIAFIIGIFAGIYGIYAFISEGIANYLFPASTFLFWNGAKSLADNISIIVLFSYIGYFVIKIITNKNKKLI
jgi:hypothetical protein